MPLPSKVSSPIFSLFYKNFGVVWNLHKRIALFVLTKVGAKPMWLLAGFMATTSFISMWMSNVATTAMMTPIAQAVLLQLKDVATVGDNNNGPSKPPTAEEHEMSEESEAKKDEKMLLRENVKDEMVQSNEETEIKKRMYNG